MKNTTEKKMNSTPTCIRTPRRHTVTKHDAITREQSTNKKPGRQYIYHVDTLVFMHKLCSSVIMHTSAHTHNTHIFRVRVGGNWVSLFNSSICMGTHSRTRVPHASTPDNRATHGSPKKRSPLRLGEHSTEAGTSTDCLFFRVWWNIPNLYTNIFVQISVSINEWREKEKKALYYHLFLWIVCTVISLDSCTTFSFLRRNMKKRSVCILFFTLALQ